MRTHVVTGSAGGLGIAIREYLEGNGDRVIGVDVRDAEVIADLSIEEGRATMIDEIGQPCGGKLDGVVANAGVLHGPDMPGALATSVNYFGAVATLDGLRPMLAKGDAPRAIGVGSSSMSVIPVVENLLDLYAAGNEAAARELSNEIPLPGEPGVYAATKFGLAQWVREQAITPEWIGSGISLNAVAPGLIATPMSPEEAQEEILKMDVVYPIPARRAATPGEIAALVGYLLSESAGYMCGSVIFIDGGTEAAVRHGDSPTPNAVV